MVKTERLARLQDLLFQQQTAFNQSCAGKILPVLFDRQGRHPGQLIGRSPYLQSVHVEAGPDAMAKVMDVTILSGSQNSLRGQLRGAGAG
jgi:tRNA-2-methylthio-N6-dimethylallyladenosine synthase